MPLFRYACKSCNKVRERILPVAQADRPGSCPACNGELERQPSGASASVVERIDTGTTVRSIERPAEAPRLFRERNLGK